MSQMTESNAPRTPAVGQGLTTSRWAQPASKSSTGKLKLHILPVPFTIFGSLEAIELLFQLLHLYADSSHI